MAPFLFPDVGEGIHEGKLVHWRVHEGDVVKQDQVLCEVETDKAVVEIPSPQPGTIQTLHGKEGEIIKVGNVLVTFADATSAHASNPSAQVEFQRNIDRGTRKVESNLVPTPPLPHEHDPPARPIEPISNPALTANTHPLAAPSTRRLARELHVDLGAVRGSGPAGRIVDADVQAASGGATTHNSVQAPSQTQNSPRVQMPNTASSTQQAVSAAQSPGATIPYSGRRKAIGEHMMNAQQVPAVTLFAQADVSDLVALRERAKASAEGLGIKLSVLPLIARAVCEALRKHPSINSSMQNESITLSQEIHLGIAVDDPKGLLVPIIRNADRKSVLELAKEIQSLAELARANKLTLEQMRGSTFSISSIGPLRVQGFTPMINTPESAILGIGAIQDQPWVVQGAVVPRKIVTLSLTFDHRVYDGAEAARFLTTLVTLVENPDMLLLGGI